MNTLLEFFRSNYVVFIVAIIFYFVWKFIVSLVRDVSRAEKK